jgi:hypothetical protein
MGRGMGKISTRLLNGDGDENELPGGSKPVAIPTSGASFLNCVSQRPPQKIFWYILVFEYTFNLNTRNTNKSFYYIVSIEEQTTNKTDRSSTKSKSRASFTAIDESPLSLHRCYTI